MTVGTKRAMSYMARQRVSMVSEQCRAYGGQSNRCALDGEGQKSLQLEDTKRRP